MFVNSFLDNIILKFSFRFKTILNEFSVSVLPAFVRTKIMMDLKNTILWDVMPCSLVDV